MEKEKLSWQREKLTVGTLIERLNEFKTVY